MQDPEKNFDRPDYRRSRVAYCTEAAFGYMITLVLSDAFLAKVLTDMGLPDELIGVVSSLVSLSSVCCLLSLALMRRIRQMKRTVIIFELVSGFFFLSTYLIPFLNISRAARITAVFVTVGGGYLCRYAVNTIYFQWANANVRPSGLAKFSAVKEVVSLLLGMLFTLCMGVAVDRYEETGRLHSAFLLIAAVIFALDLLSFISLLSMRRDDPEQTQRMQRPLREMLRAVFGSTAYRNILIMTCLCEAGRYMTFGFLGTFKTNDLRLNIGTIQLINTAGSLIRLAISVPFGIYSDRRSYVRGFRLGLIFCTVAFILNVFTTPDRSWMIIPFTILYDASLAGTGSNSNTMCYISVSPEYRPQAMAIRIAVCGVTGFLSSLVGGRILAAVQAAGNLVLGIEMRGQQLLSAVTALMMIGVIVISGKIGGSDRNAGQNLQKSHLSE